MDEEEADRSKSYLDFWREAFILAKAARKEAFSPAVDHTLAVFEEQESCLKYVNVVGIPTEIKEVITGEAEWWSALKWNESKGLVPRDLDGIFIPIDRDMDLRTQLAAINDQLQAQMQITEPTKQSGPGVEAGTSSKQKQLA